MNMNFTTLKFINNTKTDRLIKIHSFEKAESDLILDAINESLDTKLFFSDTGNLIVTKDDKEKLNFYPKIVIPNEKTKVSTSGETNLILRKNSKQTYFYSYKTGKWILYLEDESTPKFVLYYNPLARDAFTKDYLTEDTLGNALDNIAAYCLDNKGIDPACFCINVENTREGDEAERYQFCMNDLLGSNNLRSRIRLTDRQKYDTDSRFCHCINMKCLSEHPFKKRFDEDGLINKCPSSYTMTSCNVNVTAQNGGSVTTGAMNIQQKCSAQYGGGDSGPKTPKTGDTKTTDTKTTDTKTTDTKSGDATSTTASSDASTTGGTTKTDSTTKPGETAPVTARTESATATTEGAAPDIKMETMFAEWPGAKWFGIGFAVVVGLIILLIIYKKIKNRFRRVLSLTRDRQRPPSQQELDGQMPFAGSAVYVKGQGWVVKENVDVRNRQRQIEIGEPPSYEGE